MHQNAYWLIVSILVSAFLPVTAWGDGFNDAPGYNYNRPYAGPAGGYNVTGSLRLQKGMTEDGYYVRAAIEGLRPEDIQVYIRRNRLVVQIDQGDQYDVYNPGIRRSSHWQMHIRKQLRLPYDADGSRMVTSISNGIMEIYLPKMSQYTPAYPDLAQ